MENTPQTEQSQILATILQQLSEGVRELRELTLELDKKLDLHTQKLKYELENIRRTDDEQNKILEEHVAGVNTLRKIYEEHKSENDKRFAQLEEPMKWWSITKSGIVYMGSVAALVWAILQIIRWFKP